MARLMILFIVVAVCSNAAFADTTWVAAGPVFGSWTADGSPYMVQGDISIQTGDRFDIGPGVTIVFAERAMLSVGNGTTLAVEGAPGDSVRFTTDTLVSPQRWDGIYIYQADTVSMTYAVIEYGMGRADIGVEGGGLHITNGPVAFEHCTFRQNGQPHGFEGGGLWAYHASIILRNCLFEDNRAANSGGASFQGDYGTIEDCIFRHNYAERGGAIECWSSSGLALLNCLVEDNEADLWGGGIWFEGDNSSLENCTIRNNRSHRHGGGLAMTLNSHPNFYHCTISGNVADSLGGGAYSLGGGVVGDPIFDQCLFVDNTALKGGGLYLGAVSNSLIQRCTIVLNSASSHGAGIFCEPTAEPNILGSIVAFSRQGEGLANPPAGGQSFRNCDFFGNAGGEFYQRTDYTVGAVVRVNANGDSCDYWSNILLNPLFADMASGDFHLTGGSPCIDAGPSSLPHDPDGTVSDIGAFYYDQNAAATHSNLQPSLFTLSAYPNPFNPETRIVFSLPRAGDVRLEVYDLLGRRTATLVDGKLSAGEHSVNFNGSQLPSGVYICRLVAGSESVNRKLVLLK